LKPRDIVELIALAAVWGASFLFMRIAVPTFGPIALAAVRVSGATLLLVPLVVARGEWPAVVRHWKPIAVVGLMNSALPFVCLAYAAETLNAGVSAILNSATPLFSAVIAWLWLHDRLTRARILGLAIGFAGVVWIVWSKPGSGTASAAPAVAAAAAAIVAALSYGVAPSLTKRHLTSVPPFAVAAGSQLAATAMLALPAALAWRPNALSSTNAWLAAAALAVFCTGLAYILYFRLIANAGPTNAVSVTFLVPIFAVAWGGLFLGETLSWTLAAACAVVFVGTALATGIVKSRLRARSATTVA